MVKVDVRRMGGFGKPPPQGITTIRAGQAVSKHVHQFVPASEGGLWQLLIPALGSSPSRVGRGPCYSPHSSRHQKAAA